MNSSKNIIAVTMLSVILMTSLVWLCYLDGQTWIFPASASESPSAESITLLPDFMVASAPEERDTLIRLARNSVEDRSLPLWLRAHLESFENIATNIHDGLRQQPIVEFGPAINDGSRALLYIRIYPPAADRISVHLEFITDKSGWKISGVSYGRQFEDQRLNLVSSH